MRGRHIFARIVPPPRHQIAHLLPFEIDNVQQLAGTHNHSAPFARRNHDFADHTHCHRVILKSSRAR